MHDHFTKIFVCFAILLIMSGLPCSADTHYPIPKIKWSPELEQRAKNGDPKAQRDLGICILYDLGIDRDENEAFPWFEKAAKQGDPEAQTYVGDFYAGEFGDLFEDQEKTAFKWYKKAADQKFPYGVYLVALCYDLGDGVKDDSAKYMELLHKAVDMGCSDAAYHLALEYKKGKLVPHDMGKYYELFTIAADGEVPMAVIEMGKEYYLGQNVQQDFDRAFKYLSHAAKWIESNNRGYGWLKPEGMRYLSSCYRFGRGCTPNEALADKYFLIASLMESGDKDKLQEVVKSLNLPTGTLEE